MCPHSMATPEPEPADLASPSSPDLNQALERQIAAGFPPELAFDLVLHELVVRAAASTHASAAALALARGQEMVCRAATGLQAPDLGVPLNMEEGLSGACLRTLQPQLCVDTESDPLVDADAARRLGIRSMLIVPVCEEEDILGVLEVFSSEPGAFSSQHQSILELFANDCARLHCSLIESRRRLPAVSQLVPLVPREEEQQERLTETSLPAPLESESVRPSPARLYEGWTLMLGAVAILAAIGVSFLLGSRIGWIRGSVRPEQAPNPVVAVSETPAPTSNPTAPLPPVIQNPAHNIPPTIPKPDELVVYDHGKVIFRMKPSEKSGDSVVNAGQTARLKGAPVWLAPEQAEQRLRNRVEPTYPPAARETHRAGDVVLEILVGEDGSVTTARVVSGDALLSPAALDAVRHWQYEPYRANQHPAQFETEVTLRFALPE